MAFQAERHRLLAAPASTPEVRLAGNDHSSVRAGELAAGAASHRGLAIARSGFAETDERRANEQQALLDTLADLSGHLELSQLLQAVLQRAITLLGVTGGELAILDQQANEMVMVASLNLGTESTGRRMRPGEGAR